MKEQTEITKRKGMTTLVISQTSTTGVIQEKTTSEIKREIHLKQLSQMVQNAQSCSRSRSVVSFSRVDSFSRNSKRKSELSSEKVSMEEAKSKEGTPEKFESFWLKDSFNTNDYYE